MGVKKENISLIMNTLNENRAHLIRAINSYVNQVRVDLEFIISTVEGDHNIDFIKKAFPFIKIITMPREIHPVSKGMKSPRGSFMQLNNALPHITGDWFVFTGSNDYAYSNKFASEIELCLKRNKEVCYSAYDYIDSENNCYKKIYFHEYDYKKHLTGNFVADSSMISRRLVDKYLPFKIEFNNYAYWDLWLRIFEGEGDVFCYNPHPAWAYMQDENSMHIQRFNNSYLMEEAEKEKKIMLNFHL